MLLEEILVIIFDQLPLADLLRCSLVSRSWFHIINSNVRFRNKMKLKLNEKTYNDYHQLFKKIQRIHSSLTIECVYFYDYRAFFFSNIRHLSLEFCFLGSVRNVKGLIEGLTNLKTFKLRPSIYEKVVNNVQPLAKPLAPPRFLDQLDITMYPTIVDAENAWNIMRCFELIPMQIRAIHITLRSVYDVTQADNLKTILGYIDAKHGASVKKLRIQGNISIDANKVVFEHLASLKNIQLEKLELGGVRL